jgi:hypothetical protein
VPARACAARAALGAVKGPSLTEAGCDAHTRAQAAALAHVTSVLGVGGHAARTLLMHHRWSEEALFAAFAERGLDDALRDAGALSRAAAEAPAPGALRCRLAHGVRCARGAARTGVATAITFTRRPAHAADAATVSCGSCLCDAPARDATRMPCGHAFCNDCWLQYFCVKASFATLPRCSLAGARCAALRALRRAPRTALLRARASRRCRQRATPRLRLRQRNGLQRLRSRVAHPRLPTLTPPSLSLSLAAAAAQIGDGQARRVTCMAFKCGAICDDEAVARLVAPRPDVAQRYERALLESYIEDNAKARSQQRGRINTPSFSRSALR